MSSATTLQEQIEQAYAASPDQWDRAALHHLVRKFKDALNEGEVRAAECAGNTWRVNVWVKKGIMLAFRLGTLLPYGAWGMMRFFDKDTMALKDVRPDDGIRIVPGGSAIRDGAYVAKGVVMMPPAYINIGAYVDEGTMVDSHALVGSCAQIGKRVHLSAAAQIGGVLEPVGLLPVIVEDDVLVGGNCGVYEGAIVRRRAVLGSGVILTGSTPVYDLVHEKIYRRTALEPLVIPEGAVVIPGSRAIGGEFARQHGLSFAAPIIVKYRDEKTDAATALEEGLREPPGSRP